MRRPARPQRRGQVDDDAHAHRAGDRRRGRDRGPRAPRFRRSPRSPRAQCGVVPQLDNLDVTLTVEQNLLVFTYLYRVPGRERRAAIERALEIARLTDRRDRQGQRAQRRHAAATAHRAGARAPPAARAARRADRRPGPAGAPGAVGAARCAARGGRVAAHVHALHRGGAAPRRHGHDHVPRPRGRDRAAGRSSSPSTPAARRWRSTGRRRAWARWRRDARAQGMRTRRTGTSVSILRRERHGGEGERRAANLEDVFVLLTGEEID